MYSRDIKKIALLCNPLAGAGRAVVLTDQIALALKKKHIDYQTFSNFWPPTFETFTDIWIIGGDGTLNHFINRYPDAQLPLGIFGGGTGNDFHWLLYGTKTFDDQVDTMLHAEPQAIDVGTCNGLYFINGLGIGFEGAVAKALTGKKKLPGKASFMLTVLEKIFRYRSKIYWVETDTIQFAGKKLFIDISNGKRAGGGFHIAPDARADDGWLDIVTADAMSPLKRLYYLPVIEKGKHMNLSCVIHFQARRLMIESEGTIEYHTDGEYHEAGKLEIGIKEASFKFRY